MMTYIAVLLALCSHSMLKIFAAAAIKTWQEHRAKMKAMNTILEAANKR